MNKLFLMFCLLLCSPLHSETEHHNLKNTVDLAILSYDNTIEPAGEKLSTRTSEHFVALFKRGITIAVVSPQNREFLEINLVKPLLAYLKEYKEDLTLNGKLLLFPSGGKECYRAGPQGSLDKLVYQIDSQDFSHTYARDYILKTLKPELEAATGKIIGTSSILVAGAKMGQSEGENSDSGLFIKGATNLALGQEAIDGCDSTYLGKLNEGLASWMKKYRATHPHDRDQCPTMTIQTLEAVHKLSSEIVQATSKDDLLVFVGQTPAYLYPVVKEQRNAKLIAISRSKPAKTIAPDQEQLQNFCQYLASEGLTSEVLKSKNLVLIDHSYMGRAIKAVTETLNRCVQSPEDTVFRYFNFASDWHISHNKIRALDHRYLSLDKTFRVSHMAMMNIASKETLPRLVEEYPVEKWLRPPDFSLTPAAKQCIQKVVSYQGH